jgi:hypothetical protein
MRRVSIGSPLRVGALAGSIVLFANIAVSLAIDSNDLARWMLVPAVGVMAAALAVVLAQPPAAQLSLIERAISGLPAEPDDRARQRARLSVAAALAVTTVVIGGSGLAVSGAARYAMAWVTGNERGADRLVSPVTAKTHGLSLTVTHVEQTPHFTRVTVTVRNRSKTAVTMPIDGGNCALIAGDGTTRTAQSLRSEWDESVSRGSVRTGVVVFGGHLPADATRARITFAHVFGGRPEGPQAIVVANLQLLPS